MSPNETLWNQFDEIQNELDSLAEDENALNVHEIERFQAVLLSDITN